MTTDDTGSSGRAISQQPPQTDQPYWKRGVGPEKYTARVWCTRDGKVEAPDSEFCPECGHLLLTKGAYRAAFGHGSRRFNNV